MTDGTDDRDLREVNRELRDENDRLRAQLEALRRSQIASQGDVEQFKREVRSQVQRAVSERDELREKIALYVPKRYAARMILAESYIVAAEHGEIVAPHLEALAFSHGHDTAVRMLGERMGDDDWDPREWLGR